MHFSLKMDDTGRYVCELARRARARDRDRVQRPDVGDDLLAGLEDARDSGLGESSWMEQGGEYRWMFRKVDDRLTMVVCGAAGPSPAGSTCSGPRSDSRTFVAQARDAVQALSVAAR